MAAFSKRHYILIADALNSTYEAYEGNRESQRAVLVVADSIGAALAKDNQAFQWDRFIHWVKGDKR